MAVLDIQITTKPVGDRKDKLRLGDVFDVFVPVSHVPEHVADHPKDGRLDLEFFFKFPLCVDQVQRLVEYLLEPGLQFTLHLLGFFGGPGLN